VETAANAKNASPELWRLGAIESAALIARKEVSCVETTLSVMDRIALANRHVNALAEVMPAEALAPAEAADGAMASGGAIGPLHGVPVTVKVNVDAAAGALGNAVVAVEKKMDSQRPPARAATYRRTDWWRLAYCSG